MFLSYLTARHLRATLSSAALLAATTLAAQAQTPGVGIGTTAPDPAAVLDIKSSTQGVLPPRLTQAQRDALTTAQGLGTAQAGLLIYNTTTGVQNQWNGTAWTVALTGLPNQTFGPGTATYVVPAGVTRLQVRASGASGGLPNGSGTAAPGAQVRGVVTVVPGEVLTIVVGTQGGTSAGGGGTAGANGGGTGDGSAGGGGGATELRRAVANGATGDYLTTRNALLVAAGGGGTGYNGATGGAGGGPNGGTGASIGGGVGGPGATQAGPGVAATNAGSSGTTNQGGDGNTNGGGGGGGYYGGASGGGGAGGSFSGGGGGSSWVSTAVANAGYTAAAVGDGSITLSPVLANDATFDGAVASDYIQNQTALSQPANFRISGTGTAGKLGISTTAPFGSLANTPTNIIGSDGQGGNGNSLAWTSGSAGYVAMVYNSGTGGARNGLAVKTGSTDPGASVLDLSTGPSQTVAGTSIFKVRGNGFVGVGVAGTPAGRLHLVNDTNLAGGEDDYLIDEYGATGDQGLYFRRALGTAAAPVNLTGGEMLGRIGFGGRAGATPVLAYRIGEISSFYRGDGTTYAADLRFGTATNSTVSAERMRIEPNGNVGINNTIPAYRLDVGGDLNTSTVLRVGGYESAYRTGTNAYLANGSHPATAPTGNNNLLVGTNGGVGLTSGSNNTTLGYLAGDALTTGDSNTFVGIQAGGSTADGINNVFIGHDPGITNVSGSRNVGIGGGALGLTTANNNTGLGEGTGRNVNTGSFNTFVGSGADLSNTATQHDRATALGYNARVDQDDALVLGDAANAAVRVGIGTTQPSQKLDVNGTARLRGLTTAGVVTTDILGNLSSQAAPSGADFVQNQNAADQAGSFRLTGTGTVATLGVGTTAPAATAHVVGDLRVSGPVVAISQPTFSGNFGNVTTQGQSFTMPAGGGTVTSIEVNATSTASTSLTVVAGAGTGGTALTTPQAVTLAVGSNVIALTTPLTLAAGVYTFYFAGTTVLRGSLVNPYAGGRHYGSATNSNYDLAFAVDYTVGPGPFYVNTAGRVGIGTDAPTAALDVNGSARLRGLTAGVVSADALGNLSSGTATAAFGTSFIQNTTTQQASSNFNLSGSGTLGGTLTINNGDQDKIYYTLAGANGSKLGHAVNWGVLNYAGPGSGTTIGYHSWLTTTPTAYAERMRLTDAGLGLGTPAPRGLLDVAGVGDTYLVNNPANSQGQSVFLPGHLFLAPYDAGTPNAYIQARVPSPTASTNLGLVLRTTNAGMLTDAVTIAANGNTAVAGNVTVPAASAYQYAGPKAYALHLGSADYQPLSAATSKLTDANRTCYAGTANGVLEAPVHLPEGATINGITAFCTITPLPN